MSLLFPIQVEAGDIPEIPGLSYLPEYITANQEADLVAKIDAEPWDTSWERRRQPYGVSYGKATTPPPPIPDWGLTLATRMHDEGISHRLFDHMLVNEYLPGQGIALHRDYSPFDRTVVSLSLLSACVMNFRHAKSGHKAALLLERRSLLVLSDEARYEWQHGIAPRKNDRWHGVMVPRGRRLSLTFRLSRRSGEKSRRNAAGQ